MSRVESLIEETTRAPAVWMNFTRTFKKHIKKQKFLIYCFYEGKDDSKYYNERINTFGLKNLHHFECKGKSNVLKLREIILEKNSNSQYKISSLYFIDKDYDDIINETDYNYWKEANNIYVTPCYSIENCYTSKNVFKKILKSEFYLQEIDRDYKKLIKLFTVRQKEFHRCLLELNSWIVTYKYFYDKKEISEEISYGNLTLNKIINFNLESISIKLDIQDYFTSKIEVLPNNFLEVKETMKNTLKINPKCNFRGKFEIDFLYSFITLINDDKSEYNNLSFHIQKKNLVSNISQYANTPKCLKKHIKKATNI